MVGKISESLVVVLVIMVLIMTTGCTTVQNYKAGETSWQSLALSSCQDLQLTGTAASAAVAWAKVYFPNKDEQFKAVIDPFLLDLASGVDAYCAAADLVQGVDGMQALLQKKTEILLLATKLSNLVATIKGS